MNDTVVWNTVVGASIPLPSGFNARIGCRLSTTNPTTNVSTLNSMYAQQYCFQFCGPVSTRSSNQRSQRGARKPPSNTQRMYPPMGTASSTVTTTTRIGRVHMSGPFPVRTTQGAAAPPAGKRTAATPQRQPGESSRLLSPLVAGVHEREHQSQARQAQQEECG